MKMRLFVFNCSLPYRKETSEESFSEIINKWIEEQQKQKYIFYSKVSSHNGCLLLVEVWMKHISAPIHESGVYSGE